MDKQWVQHISGQGEKWEVAKEYEEEWAVQKKVVQPSFLYFPKSEFRLTNPPEQWINVTMDCDLDAIGHIIVGNTGHTVQYLTSYRLKKYSFTPSELETYIRHSYHGDRISFFIVEKKVPA